MRQSQLFTKTRKEAPRDEVAKNAELLIRAGYIHKEMAGVYSYLPLGVKVLNKIANIIREEMNSIGGQELHLTALQDKNVWEKSGRWSDKIVDNWFKTKLKNETELGLGFTHEEPLTLMMTDYIQSFRDLPKSVYQIQTKFRNETRAKSGIMRGREFLMKDLYSFCKDENEHNKFYETAKKTYLRIFSRVGLGDKTYTTLASGGTFSKYSHEFQTKTEAGEDIIHICEQCKIAINNELISEYSKCQNCGNEKLIKQKAVEVGNIFTLGTKYSDVLGLQFTDESGTKKPVFMGSYGIGLGRLMGTVVEVLSDDKGIIWPESISPFSVHLLSLSSSDSDAGKFAETFYTKLVDNNIEVLYDDRDVRAGEKFADSDLIGIPYRIVISEKTIKSKKVEFKRRASEISELIDENAVIKILKK